MKRIFVVSLVLATLLLSSCSPEGSTNENRFDNVTPAQTDTITEVPTATPAPTPTKVPYSAFTNTVFQTFYDVKAKYDLSYDFKSLQLRRNAYDNFEFQIQYIEVPSMNGIGTVSIDQKTDSFSIEFFNSTLGNTAPPMVKASITAALFSIDPSLSIKEAQLLTMQLVESYTGNEYSDILIHNGYSLVIVPYSSGPRIYVLNNDKTMPTTFDKAKYFPGKTKSLTSALNVGERFVFRGTVDKIGPFMDVIGDFFAQYFYVTTDNGESITIAIQYDKLPLAPKVGNTYSFYGYVSAYTKGDAILWAEAIQD